MKNIANIARKELSIYFTTPWAYLGAAAMLFLTSFPFIGALTDFAHYQQDMRPGGRNLTDAVIGNVWGTTIVITLFVAPFLAMRLFAEEKRQKTFELLMTLPVRPLEIVLGKYLGGLAALGATVGLTIAYPFIVSIFGSSESGSALEWSTVMLGYLAVLLAGAACLAVSMFISSLTESQALAAVLSFAVLLVWLFIGWLSHSAEGPLRAIGQHISLTAEVEELLKGVLDLKSLVFFASIIFLSIFLTQRSVEAQRWT